MESHIKSIKAWAIYADDKFIGASTSKEMAYHQLNFGWIIGVDKKLIEVLITPVTRHSPQVGKTHSQMADEAMDILIKTFTLKHSPQVEGEKEPEPCPRCRSEYEKAKCGHNIYWQTVYGNCMACRNEKSEAEIERLKKENEELEKCNTDFSCQIRCLQEELDLSIKLREGVEKENEEMEHEVSKVYCHITCSKFSKPNTIAEYVIEAADEYYEKMYSDWKSELEEKLERYEKALNQIASEEYEDHVVEIAREALAAQPIEPTVADKPMNDSLLKKYRIAFEALIEITKKTYHSDCLAVARKAMQKCVDVEEEPTVAESARVQVSDEDPSLLTAEYVTQLPEGCPPFDVIKAHLVNAQGKKIELFMTPDEAMLLANNLIGASLEALFEDKNFHERFIASREKWSAMANEGKKDL